MNYSIGTIGGQSFHGAGQYYLHDKRQDGMGAFLTTGERVTWTDTRNLLDVGPHTAIRRMIDTAERADELKAAAGIGTGGRKAGGSVFTFSLNWHPDELPNRDRETMIKAVDGALKTLGLDHLQCLIVAHHDEPQPHVHVILNRVDFNNGKTTPINKARFHALDKFCHYETAPEFRHLSPDRAAKYAAQERGRELEPDIEKRRAFAEAKRKARAAAPAKTEKDQHFRDSRAAKKAERSERQRITTNHAHRAKDAQKTIDAAAIKAQHKAEMKPHWSAMFKKHRDELWTMKRNERGFLGGFLNAVLIVDRMGLSGDRYTSTLWKLCFASAGRREAMMKQIHEREQKAMGKASYDRLGAMFQQERAKLHAAARERSTAYATARIIERERTKTRQRGTVAKWRKLNPRPDRNAVQNVRAPEHAKSAWEIAARAATGSTGPLGHVWMNAGKTQGRKAEWIDNRRDDKKGEDRRDEGRSRDRGPDRG